MGPLVDPCTFLRLVPDDPKLSDLARDSCRSPDNSVYLSAL